MGMDRNRQGPSGPAGERIEGEATKGSESDEKWVDHPPKGRSERPKWWQRPGTSRLSCTKAGKTQIFTATLWFQRRVFRVRLAPLTEKVLPMGSWISVCPSDDR